MKIYSVYDPEFRHYGQIVEGMEDAEGAYIGLSGENIDIADLLQA